ncbi:MAG: rod shape-determining protein RodA [Bdellovibrionales bacterium]
MDISLSGGEKSVFQKIDWTLVILILCLHVLGLINLYSATHGPLDTNVAGLFMNQILWLGIGWTVFLVLTLLDYNLVNRVAYVVYFLNLMALLYVTFFGKVALGAQRWIDLGSFHYQPSETMKLAMVVVLAKLLGRYTVHGRGLGFRELFVPLILLGLPFGLVVEQPDLGTAMMITAVSISMIIFCKVQKSIIVGAFIAMAVTLPLAWKYGLHDYQRNRVITFLSPNNDPRGTGYNSIQSRIAVGSGQFFGKGYRKGTQSQLEFLPERHTDFIFSVLSEEWGFVGSLLTLGIFCGLFYTIVRIASGARDKYGALLCVGVLCYVFWHMFVNVGMVIGLLPIVGVPLPLVSYGGSSMLTTMTGMGLISSVAFRRYIF